MSVQEYENLIAALDTIPGTRKIANFLEERKNAYLEELAKRAPQAIKLTDDEAASKKELLDSAKQTLQSKDADG